MIITCLSPSINHDVHMLLMFFDYARMRCERYSPVEGLLVLLDLAARQLMEFRVNIHKLVLLLHLFALFELVVDPLPPVEQTAEFGVRWHDPD